MRSNFSRSAAKSEIITQHIAEFNDETIEEYYNGKHKRYYGIREAFLSLFVCCRIKRSYGFIKNLVEKVRRFKKDVDTFEKETDVIKIISGIKSLIIF